MMCPQCQKSVDETHNYCMFCRYQLKQLKNQIKIKRNIIRGGRARTFSDNIHDGLVIVYYIGFVIMVWVWLYNQGAIDWFVNGK